MSKTAKRIFTFCAGTAALWAAAVKPRLLGKPDMSDLRRYDFAAGGLHNIRNGIPENTLAAFDKAAEQGYGVLIDVRLTRDGEAVAFRDSLLRRMCGCEGTVENSMIDDLEELDVAGTDEHIPTLEEALACVDGRVPVVVRLHTAGKNSRSLCEKAAKDLDAYEGVFAVESSDVRILYWLRRHRERWIRGFRMSRQQVPGTVSSAGKSVRQKALQILGRNLLLNVFTAPDYLLVPKGVGKHPSLILCRLLYNIPVITGPVKDMDAYADVKASGGIVEFEGMEP